MRKPNNKPSAIPALSKAAAAWLSNALDAPLLHSLITLSAADAQVIFRGFPIAVRNANRKLIRKRVAAELVRNPEFRSRFLHCPDTPWAVWETALDGLRTPWLRQHWRSLARTRTGTALPVAMARHPEPAVARRGCRVLLLTDWWAQPQTRGRPVEPPPAWLAIQRLAAPRPCPEPAAEPQPEADDRRPEEQADRQRQQAQQRETKLQTQIKEEKAHRDRDTTTWNLERRQLRAQLKEMRAAQDTLAAELDERVKARVRQFQRDALGMTEELKARRAELAKRNPGDLLARVQTAIELQAQRNAGHAMRQEVRHQLQQLRDALDAAERSVRESLLVLPEMGSLQEELREQIATHEALLDEARDSTADRGAPTARLLARIRSATLHPNPAAELDRLDAMLTADAFPDIFGGQAASSLQRALAKQRELLQNATQAAALDAAPIPAPRSETAPRAIWNLETALPEQTIRERVWIFVDGYNVVKGGQPFQDLNGHGNISLARDRFLDCCRNRAHSFAHMEIVFDGSDTLDTRNREAALTVVFTSRRQESQNADRYLVHRLRCLRRHPERILWLVTDDQGLRRDAEPFADGFVAVQDFCRYLNP